MVLPVFIFTNLFTHGIFWTTWNSVSGGYVYKLVLFETLIWLVEAGIYRRFFRGSIKRALVASLAANVLSLGAGLAYGMFAG